MLDGVRSSIGMLYAAFGNKLQSISGDFAFAKCFSKLRFGSIIAINIGMVKSGYFIFDTNVYQMHHFGST